MLSVIGALTANVPVISPFELTESTLASYVRGPLSNKLRPLTVALTVAELIRVTKLSVAVFQIAST